MKSNTPSSHQFLSKFYLFFFVLLFLGFNTNFSFAQTGGGGELAEPCKGENEQVCPKKDEKEKGDPVILSTGNFEITKTDLSIPGRTMDFEFTRFYRSGTITASPLGVKWNHNWNKYIEYIPPPLGNPKKPPKMYPWWCWLIAAEGWPPWEIPECAAVRDPGSIHTISKTANPNYLPSFERNDQKLSKDFVSALAALTPQGKHKGLARYYNGETRADDFTNSGAGWVSPGGYYSKLIDEGDVPLGVYGYPQQFRLRDAQGYIFTFGYVSAYNPFGTYYYLTKVEDRKGNAIHVVYETVASFRDRIDYIIDELGRKIDFIYDSFGRLSMLKDFDGREVAYTHDQNANLITVTSPKVDGTSTGNNFSNGKTVQYIYGDPTDPQKAHQIVSFIDANEVLDGSLTPSIQNTYISGTNKVIKQIYGRTNASGIPAGGTSIFIYDEDTIGGAVIFSPFNYVFRTFYISPNGNVSIYAFSALNSFEQGFYECPGRINPETIDPVNPPNIDDLILVDSVTQAVSLNPAATGYEPPLRPGNSTCYLTTKSYNVDGRVTGIDYPEGNHVVYTYDEDNKDIFQRGNLLKEERFNKDGSQVLTTISAYEPFYNQVRAVVDPRGNDPAYVPPNGGATSPNRYMTSSIFDYQEGSASSVPLKDLVNTWDIDIAQTKALAKLNNWGVNLGAMAFNLGDVNNDQITNQIFGNTIKASLPDAQVYVDATDPNSGFQTQTTSIIKVYNDFSLLESFTDPEGHATRYEYYSEADPDGDGTVTPNPQISGWTLSTVTGAKGGGYAYKVFYPENVNETFNYDPLGRAIQYTNPRGFLINTEYNALDQVVRLTNARGYRKDFYYDANNNLIREELKDDVYPELNSKTQLPTGNEITNLNPIDVHIYIYDILDRKIRSDSYVNPTTIQSVHYRYDKDGKRVLLLYPEYQNDPNNVVSTVYDERGLAWTVTMGDITPQFRSLSAHANIPENTFTAIPPSITASTSYSLYDGNKNLIWEVDGESKSTTYGHDEFDRTIAVTDAAGNLTQVTYDPSSYITDITLTGEDGYGQTILLSHARQSYDEQGRVYQTDNKIFPIASSFSAPDGPLSPGDGWVTTRLVFDKKARVIQAVDDNIHSTYNSYDDLNRLIQNSDSIGNFVNYTYDLMSNVVQTLKHDVSSNGNTFDEFKSWNFYDNLHRLTASVDNIGQTKRFLYNSRNQLVFTSDAEGLGSLLLSSLDSYSEYPGLTGPNINDHGNTTIYFYDDANRRVSTVSHLRIGGAGAGAIDSNQAGDGKITTTNQYDLNNRVTAIADDNNNTTRYIYDSLNRPKLTQYADGTIAQVLSYNKEHYPLQVRDQNGSIFTNNYDNIYRLTTRNIQTTLEGTTIQNFVYDGLKRITSAADNNDPANLNDDETTGFKYDSFGRVLQETTGGQLIQGSYDGVGNMISTRYPDGRVIDHTYDVLDRIKNMTEGSSPVINVADYNYIGGRLQNRDLDNGLVHLTRNYDALGRPMAHLQNDASANLLAGFDYGYNRVNGRTFESRQHDNGHGRVWQYDSLYRVTQEKFDVANPSAEWNSPGSGGPIGQTTDFTIDGVQNLNTVTINGIPTVNAVNAVNEYTLFKGLSQNHDNNGSRTQDGTKTFKYDALNRLLSVSDNGQEIVRFTYDALSRRMQKILPNQSGIRFIHRGNNLLEERDRQNNTLIRQYILGSAINEALQLRTFDSQQQATDYYYLTDLLGSMAGLVDSSGSVVERVKYDLYGQPTFTLNGNTTNPLLFAGAYYDQETNLYYMRNRYYDPDQGRFITRDPIGMWEDGFNLGNGYAYVGNNAVNLWDPLGLKVWAGLIHGPNGSMDFTSQGTRFYDSEGRPDGDLVPPLPPAPEPPKEDPPEKSPPDGSGKGKDKDKGDDKDGKGEENCKKGGKDKDKEKKEKEKTPEEKLKELKDKMKGDLEKLKEEAKKNGDHELAQKIDKMLKDLAKDYVGDKLKEKLVSAIADLIKDPGLLKLANKVLGYVSVYNTISDTVAALGNEYQKYFTNEGIHVFEGEVGGTKVLVLAAVGENGEGVYVRFDGPNQVGSGTVSWPTELGTNDITFKGNHGSATYTGTGHGGVQSGNNQWPGTLYKK